MPATHQNLRALLAQGNLEAALQALVHLTAHTDDADLRQRVLTLSGQFAALKKQHLTGLLEDKDYRLQLNRITAAVAEIVDNEARESVCVTQNHADTPNEPSSFWKKIGYVGLLVGILAGVVQVVDYVQKQQPALMEKPATEPPKPDPVAVPVPHATPPAVEKNNVKIEVKDKGKVGNIITGDSNKIEIKQDF